MSVPSTEFQEYLAPDESVIDGVPGTMIDRSSRSEGSIGVTDRRVLFVSDGQGFQDIAHDSISSIRSRPRTSFTARGIGYRLATVLGAVVAASAFVGVLALRSGFLVALLALTAVGGIVVAEYVRRSGVDVDWRALGEARSLVRRGPVALLVGLAATDVLRRPGEAGNEHGGNDLLVLGVTLVSLSATVGLVVVTGSLLVVPLALVGLGGLVWAEYAFRRTRVLDTVGGSRRHEWELSIDTVNGRTVHLRVDSRVPLDRELSGVAREAVVENGAREVELPSS